jgi:hypothetical protein
VLFEGQPAPQRLAGVDAWVREHLRPQDILAVLEALTAEGLLTRRGLSRCIGEILYASPAVPATGVVVGPCGHGPRRR